MDLDLSEEQRMLRDTVRGLCSRYSTPELVRAMEDDPAGYQEDFWKQLASLGLLGLTLSQRWGGSQLSLIDAAVVYEEFGRALAPSPHFVSSMLCARALALVGGDEHERSWLPALCAGEAILTPAWLEPGNGFGARGVQMRASVDGDGYRLDGEKYLVPYASSATRLLVLVRSGDGDEDVDLLLVDPASDGIEMTQQFTLAADNQYKVRFDDVRVPLSDRVGPELSGWATWNEVMHDGIIVVAAQAMGGAERALEMTVQYAKEREQFDKPLGAFQAIAHYLADAATAVDGGRTLVYQAAWARSHERPVDRLAPMAKLFACQTFRDVTAMAEQVHGGLGFTVEYDIQLYFRRAKQLQLSWWDSRYLEELIAAAVLDRGREVAA